MDDRNEMGKKFAEMQQSQAGRQRLAEMEASLEDSLGIRQPASLLNYSGLRIELLQKLGKRLAELLDEDQFAECEKLLIDAGVVPNAEVRGGSVSESSIEPLVGQED